MSIEPIGIITVMCGFIILISTEWFAIGVFVVATLLGASAAFILGSGGQIQPAHLLLGFLAAKFLNRRQYLYNCLTTIQFPFPGFWLSAFTAFCIISAVFFPRIFEGKTYINAIGATDHGPSILLTPLGPVGGNITQSIYMVANLVCFLLFSSICKSPSNRIVVAKSLVFYSSLNIIFGVCDIITYSSGTTFLMDPIRNAQYDFHLSEEIGGLKRIAGSFTETSSFAYATIGSLSFCLTLWLQGRWTASTATISAASIVALILSTSSTAIVVTPVVMAISFYSALIALKHNPNNKRAFAFAIGAPSIVLLLTFFLLLNQNIYNTVKEYLDVLIFEKASSDSGLTRASWNAAAVTNLLDTSLIGAGLGSVRTSSFPIAVISNVGLLGAILMAIFLISTVSINSRWLNNGGSSDFATAARNSIFGLLLAATVSGSLVDLGLIFFVFAALASSVQ